MGGVLGRMGVGLLSWAGCEGKVAAWWGWIAGGLRCGGCWGADGMATSLSAGIGGGEFPLYVSVCVSFRVVSMVGGEVDKKFSHGVGCGRATRCSSSECGTGKKIIFSVF